MNSVSNKMQGWPVDGLESVDTCPVCGSAERTLLYEDLTDKVFSCAPGQWSLKRCTDCRSAFLDPRPTLGTISSAYNSYYTHETTLSDITRRSRLWHLRRSLRNDYFNHLYHVALSPAWRLGHWIIPLLYKKRSEEYLRHLPPGDKPGSIVDIGCGNGEFLRVAMEIGWDAWGVDFDPKAVELARKTGATVTQCGLPNTGLPSGRFDVVTLNHVIEHVHDPLATLREAFRILKPGGQLWLGTPNLDSFGHSRFRFDWRGLEAPRHLVIFTRNSLKKALINSGFTNVDPKPCVPMAIWFYRSSFRMSLGEDPNDDRSSSLPIALRLAAKFADYRANFTPYRSENIIVIAKRPTNT